jgi:hypothetical protein
MHYTIVCREQQWQLLIEGQPVGLLQSDDRDYLVGIACKVAAERRTSVQVFDAADQLEARLSFEGGVLAIHGTYQGHVQASHVSQEPDVQV